jgi:hypothetical protein
MSLRGSLNNLKALQLLRFARNDTVTFICVRLLIDVDGVERGEGHFNELTEKLNNMLTESADQESLIKLLRLNNYSKTESIEFLKKALDTSYYEAQDIIHNSQTWSDVKEFDTKIINDFFDILEELGSSESEET